MQLKMTPDDCMDMSKKTNSTRHGKYIIVFIIIQMSLKYNYFKKIKTIYVEIKCMATTTQRL